MINSHYVPQFILRNLYIDNKITYCDLEKKTVESRNTKSIFSEEGYYPEEIEKALCKKVEYQFANLYHNKLENARNNFFFTDDELFLLKKFLIVSVARYKEELTEEGVKWAEIPGSLYKRDSDCFLNEILKCESLKSAFDLLLPRLQGRDIMNKQLYGEMKDIFHSYLVFVKPRGEEKFLIPDIGRGFYRGPFGVGKITTLFEHLKKTGDPNICSLIPLIGVRDYAVYPLSPCLAVLTMNSYFKLLTESEFHYNVILPKDYPTVSAILRFGDRNIIAPPKVKMRGLNKEFHYEIRAITPKDVSHLNCIMLAEAKRYVGCAGLNTIQKCLDYINGYSERDYSFLRMH